MSQVNLPAGLQPNYSPLSSATGEIYRYTLVGADLTTLRTLQDWTVTRRLRSIPGVADVSTFGGLEKEYQIQLDPARLRARGVTIKQVTDAVVVANASAGGGFIEHGSDEYVVRGLGLFRDIRDIESVTVTSMNGTPLTVRDVASVHIGARPRLGKVGWRVGQSQTDVDDAVLGLVLLQRGESPDAVLEETHKTVEHLNDGTRLPEGVRIVPLLDRSDLVHTTTRTVEHNLIEGVIEAQVKSEPRNAEAKAILAGLLLHVKKDDEAKTMARAALAQDPQESHAQAILAQITTREGDDAGARRMLEQALRYDKNNDHLLGSLGEISLRQKDGAAAAKYLRKAVSFAPEHRHWRELLDEANEMIGAGAATSATDKIPVTQKTPIMEKTPN